MSIFSNPEVIRNGTDIAYKFNIVSTTHKITTTLTRDNYTSEINPNIFSGVSPLFEEFLLFSNTFFSKKYTLEIFSKNIIYNITNLKDHINLSYSESNNKIITIVPKNFVFTLKGIYFNWEVLHPKTCEPNVYELPELIEPTAQAQAQDQAQAQTKFQSQAQSTHAQPNQPIAKTSNDFEEVNIDTQPVIDLEDDDNSEVIIADMSRSVARSKVREARLKARIARLKAERSTEKYLAKYGVGYSDLDDSETDTEAESNFNSEGENEAE